MNLTFTDPIAGEFPCQAEGFIVETNEPFYFKQRGNRAFLHIYDRPLSASLDKGETPNLIVKYQGVVPRLNGDASHCPEQVMPTIISLLALHENYLEQRASSSQLH
ncbi:MAG: hypothetical protein Q8T09_11160 [Candidatus Melainabacteria bacterium]|nr:hypothetical protein [Candidatus Melainabacteria bacterium]